MSDDYSDGGWLQSIGKIADAQMQRRREEELEKARYMRTRFCTKARVVDSTGAFVIWRDDEPLMTATAPDELLECDKSLVAIFDEWQRRNEWYDYWKDSFEFERERQKKDAEK